MTMRPRTFTSVLSVGVAVAGVLFGHWLFVAGGILLALALGHGVTALLLAVLADLFFGAPTGVLKATLMPFTLVSLVVIALRAVLVRQMRESAPYTL